MTPTILVPIYNHGETIGDVLASIERLNCPCLVVDDGSDAEVRDHLHDLEHRYERVTVHHLSTNRGKGTAIHRGLSRARDRGFTHAVLVDADGQHRVEDVPRFLEAARDNPGALILGDPVFDDSIPASRLYGRKLSQFWVWVETLSFDIHDPLVGFRCYPVDRTLALVEQFSPGRRMEFEPEIAVLYQWTYGRIVNVPTPIRYDPDGVSHFRYVTDNVRISWMHMRLLCGMILRLPRLLS